MAPQQTSTAPRELRHILHPRSCDASSHIPTAIAISQTVQSYNSPHRTHLSQICIFPGPHKVLISSCQPMACGRPYESVSGP